MAGVNESGTDIRFPYGGEFSQGLVNNLRGSQIDPLLNFLGFGPPVGSRKFARQQQRLETGSGPLADAIRAIRGYAPSVVPDARAIGDRVASAGEASYAALQDEIARAMAALPATREAGARGLSLAGEGADLAQRYARRASSPIADEDLYQVATRRVMEQLRPSLAARGLESSGEGAQATTDATRDLALGFAENRRSDQRQSLDQLLAAATNLQSAAGNNATLAGAGVPLAQASMEAVGRLGQYLQQRFGIPMQATGALLNLLTAGQSPGLALTQATGPIGAPESKGVRVL